ncbi:MAG TPA: nucleotidyltransferase domain-containing protein [archaeon]|nr:nucleotidyltransferase domain-containing protein [archaeon]
MEQVLQEFVQDVQELYGGELVAVYLYGSTAAGEHVAGRSDVNVAVVLRQLTPALLRKAAPHLRRWYRQGFATPLFFDPETLHGSLDVFPIEFLDMQERHRMLWGPDLFASLHIELQNLRLQCEQELRGKLMKLRQSYVESALAPVDLERVLVAATASIVVLARTLLRLGGGDSAGKVDVVLEQIQARFAVPTIALRKACQLKRGHIRVAGSGTEELYCEVLSEMQGLVGVVDKLNA